jgi:hypothetical protein
MQPVVAPETAGPLPLKEAMVARAQQLMTGGGRFANQAVMTPFYRGVASALNVQPAPVGSSAFYRTPESIVSENPSAYGESYDALPDDVKNALILNAINASYANPAYRNPLLNWQRAATPTPFE